MSTLFCINVWSIEKTEKEEIEFFNSDHWTYDSELLLIQSMHELLNVIRPVGKSFELNLNIEVSDFNTAIILINKKLKKGCEINHYKLSMREIEILGLIMLGYTNNDIAKKLFISFETVKSHRKNILIKTGAKNTASLINYYHQTFFDK